MAFYDKKIKELEKAIDDLIQGDTEMSRAFTILISIKGVGKINAWMTIAYTENFNAFDNPRAYACYVGVAPFENSSGTSIRGKSRTSKMRRTDVKAVLTMAARSAKEYNTEFKLYAEKKEIEQKKHKGIVINNICFKLICLMFCLVKNQRLYVDRYNNAA